MVGVTSAAAVYRAWGATLVVTTDGSVYCAGSPVVCARGKDAKTWDVSLRRVEGLSDVQSISGFGSRISLLLRDGTLRAWSGKTPDDRARRWIAHAEGQDFTCAIAQGGDVYCKGSNFNGQLGDGTTEGSSDWVRVAKLGPAKSLDASRNGACAILRDGNVACWGEGLRHQAKPGRQFSEGPSLPVILPDSAGSTVVLAGGGIPCALSAAGQLRCWRYVVLPGSTEQVLQPLVAPPEARWASLVDVVGEHGARHALRRDGTITAERAVLGVEAAIALARGDGQCAITTDRGVLCWGSNETGERGLGALPDVAIPVQGLD